MSRKSKILELLVDIEHEDIGLNEIKTRLKEIALTAEEIKQIDSGKRTLEIFRDSSISHICCMPSICITKDTEPHLNATATLSK
jgi:hypothetical protein